MGLIKSCLKMFRCKSSCTFNDEIYDESINRTSLSQYELKHGDIKMIHRILTKRKKKELMEGKVCESTI